jgi:hypothetical protein
MAPTPDADRRPQSRRCRTPGDEERVVARNEPDVDSSRAERRRARAGCDGSGGEPEPGPDQHARPDLRGHNPNAPGGDEERGPDRAVADLARDRHRAQQCREQRAEDLSPGEQPRELLRGAVEGPCGEAEAVEQSCQQDKSEHGTEEAQSGPGRALLEKLSTQRGAHNTSPAVSLR